MIYLFCSASTPLYKRDALECICYPPEHFFRFRYSRGYVDPQVRDSPQSFQNKQGLIVFVDTIGKEGHENFDFLPIRKIRTVRIFPEGHAMYVDFKFGDFVNFGSVGDETQKKSWSEFFLNLPSRPWPPFERSGRKKEESEGYFLLWNEANNPSFTTSSPVAHEAWENLVHRLNSTNDLTDSTFFQILGFYRMKKSCSPEYPFSEVPIVPQDNCYDSVYPLPMGKSAVLKLLFSRPTFDRKALNSRRTLELKYEKEAFAGASKSQVHSDSRYNEERIVLVCKRVFDSFLSPVSIEQKDEPSSVQAPKPFLLITVQVPRFIVFGVVLGVLLSTIMVALDADSIKFLGSMLFPACADYFERNAKTISALVKAISPIPISISAYLAFRKLPLK